LALTTFLGAPPQGEATSFPLLPADHAAAEALLLDARPPLIGLHPAARAQTRRWPIEYFAAVATELDKRYGGTIVLLGDREEQVTAARVGRLVGVPCLDLIGITSLPVLGAVIARLAVLITNDTGPAHIAYALETPTVTIFGGGDPQRNGPLQQGPYCVLAHPVPCRPCDVPVCPIGYICLEGITVAQVVDAAEWMIGS